MRDQLRKIKEGHEAFRLTPDSTPYNEHHRPDPRETTSKVIQSSIIGRDKERKQVVSLLSASDEEDSNFANLWVWRHWENSFSPTGFQ